MVRIFPIRPMSNYDIIKNFFGIVLKSAKNCNSGTTDVVTINKTNQLKKGRNICDRLSE